MGGRDKHVEEVCAGAGRELRDSLMMRHVSSRMSASQSSKSQPHSPRERARTQDSEGMQPNYSLYRRLEPGMVPSRSRGMRSNDSRRTNDSRRMHGTNSASSVEAQDSDSDGEQLDYSRQGRLEPG